MNLIDFALVMIITFGVIKAIYKGFLNTLFGIAMAVAAIILASIITPIIAKPISNTTAVSNALVVYIDAASDLDSVDTERAEITSLSETEVSTIIDAANYPSPFARLIKKNIAKRAFADEGKTTIGEYANRTVACALANSVCFFILFFIIYLILRYLINVADKSKPFYVLKQYEMIYAGLSGFLLYILLLSILFIAVPFVLVILDISMINKYVSSSLIGSLFYKANLFITAIRGVL